MWSGSLFLGKGGIRRMHVLTYVLHEICAHRVQGSKAYPPDGRSRGCVYSFDWTFSLPLQAEKTAPLVFCPHFPDSDSLFCK